jgi:hypothetical protein
MGGSGDLGEGGWPPWTRGSLPAQLQLPPLIFLIREAIDKAINQLIHFPSVCWARLIFFSLFQQGKSEGRKHASNIILTLTFLRLISLYITFLYITYLSLLYICFNLITLS